MKSYEFTINGEQIELGTNDNGQHLFVIRDGDWKQIKAGYVATATRALVDDKYLRRAVYRAYRRHFVDY